MLIGAFVGPTNLSPTALAAEAEYRASIPEACLVRVVAMDSEDDGNLGNGTIIRGGNVITAWHVVDGAKRVLVKDRFGHARKARSWRRLGRQDVAIIVLENIFKGVNGLEVAKKAPTKQTWGTIHAYWGMGQFDGLAFHASGVVYPKPRLLGGVEGTFIGVTIAAQPGMSGCPLLVDGKIVAVCSHGPGRSMGYGFNYWALADAESTAAKQKSGKEVPPAR